MQELKELYEKQIENSYDELYLYLSTIYNLCYEAMNLHESINERKNKLKENMENESI